MKFSIKKTIASLWLSGLTIAVVGGYIGLAITNPQCAMAISIAVVIVAVAVALTIATCFAVEAIMEDEDD